MTREDKALLLAMVMGDGSLSKSGHCKSVSLRITHASRQREYLEYKSQIVNSVCGGKQNPVRDIDNNGYPGCTYSKAHRYFRVLYKALYKDGRKQYPPHVLRRFTKKGFAIWWMDDGGAYPKRRGGRIHAWLGYLNTYTNRIDSLRIADMVETLVGVRPLLRRHKGAFRLEFNTTKLRIMLPQIAEHVVPCMAYKLDASTSAERPSGAMR